MYSIAICPVTPPVRLSGFHWATAVSSIPLLAQVLINEVWSFLLRPVDAQATHATRHKYRQRVTIVPSLSSSLTAKRPCVGPCGNGP